MSEDRKNVYVTLHKDFVRTDIEYADRATGETRTFNSVTLPKGTVIDGTDVGYYQFSPLFVNPSRFKGGATGTSRCSQTARCGFRKRCSITKGNP